MKNLTAKKIAQGAMIAALYVVLTLLVNALGLANGVVQVRISEALTILPYFTEVAIPGLFVGCLISNIITGCLLPDIIFGSIATLIGAIGTYYIGRHRSSKTLLKNCLSDYLAPIPPILSNTVIIPFILRYVYDMVPLWFSFVTVFAGELISCGIFGLILLFALKPHRNIFD